MKLIPSEIETLRRKALYSFNLCNAMNPKWTQEVLSCVADEIATMMGRKQSPKNMLVVVLEI